MENMWIKKEEWDNYKECMQKLDAIWWRHTGSKVFSKETFEKHYNKSIKLAMVSKNGEQQMLGYTEIDNKFYELEKNVPVVKFPLVEVSGDKVCFSRWARFMDV